MQVIQIIKEDEVVRVRNSRELARAFDDTADGGYQWTRIANYFAVQRQRSLGENRGQINGRMSRIHSDVGKDMPEQLTTTTWNLRARSYGMDTPQDRPTWQDIYNHLAPHADYALPEGWEIPGAGQGAGTSSNSTPELDNEVAAWIETERTSWDNADELRSEYLGPWLQHVQNLRGEDFSTWLAARGSDGNRNNNNFLFYKNLSRVVFPRIISGDGEISKGAVDQRLYNWLVRADMSFQNYREAN